MLLGLLLKSCHRCHVSTGCFKVGSLEDMEAISRWHPPWSMLHDYVKTPVAIHMIPSYSIFV